MTATQDDMIAELQRANAELRRERDEREAERIAHQAATIDVLKEMSASPGDPQPVFDLIVHRARELCNASGARLFEYDGALLHYRSTDNHNIYMTPEAHEAFRRRFPMAPTRDFVPGRAVLDREIIHVRDMDQALWIAPVARNLGHKSTVAVPLIRDHAAIGAITVNLGQYGGFTDTQIELLKTFAEQAVIAIAGAATLRELRNRTADLQESLEYQTATSDVLKVISRSAFDLQAVFETIVETATRLCGADAAGIANREGEALRMVTNFAAAPEFDTFRHGRILPIDRGSVIARAALEGKVVHVADIAADPDYTLSEAVTLQRARTVLGVPLLREGDVVGSFSLVRQRMQPFTERQIELVRTFADQAVIALENARLLGELRARTASLQESLEYQIATSDVLKVISRSAFDLGTVLQTVVSSATNLCLAERAILYRYRDGACHFEIGYNNTPEYERLERATPIVAGRETVVGRAMLERRTVQIVDALNDPDYKPKDQARINQVRSMLGVPLLRDGVLIGVFGLARTLAEPFTDKQIELVSTFADQAVIAIENTRLLTEQQEALEQQTATAEVLRVINASPGDLAPVFEVMLDKALRLCDARFGQLITFDGVGFRAAAWRGYEPEPDRPARGTLPEPGMVLYRIIHGENVVQVPDITADEVYRSGNATRRRLADQFGARTAIWVALKKDAALLGAFVIYRTEVLRFTDKQIALLQNFAAQAVIAIENARLITEQREALEQQTATAEVLHVINASPGELTPVFDTILDNSMRLCGAAFGSIYTYDGERFHSAAQIGVPAAYAGYRAKNPPSATGGGPPARLLVTKRPYHIVDMMAEESYKTGNANVRAMVELGGARSIVGVPLVKDNSVLGFISIYRQEVRAFSDKQIALLENFAAQAVIAIGSVATFRALRERTTELTRSVGELQSLEEVLRAVNSSLDLDTVLATIISRAVHLSGADEGMIYEFDEADGMFVPKSAVGMTEDRIAGLRQARIKLGETYLGRSALERMPVHVDDVQQYPDLGDAAGLLEGIHAVLAVPLLKEDKVVGGLVIRRRTKGGFAPTTVTLMSTFASQSALAMQNAGLFQQLAEKSRQLQQASEHKSQFLANMSHELRAPLNAILGYTELLVDGIYGELPPKPRGVLDRVLENGRNLLALINDVLDLAKIEAGQFMLSLDTYEIAPLVLNVMEALQPLAHGKGLSLVATVADDIPAGYGDSRRLRQVLVNLVGNAIKFTDAGEVGINVAAADGRLDVAVRDTGPGIAPEDQEKIFEEFQQVDNSSTRRKGGTGLGLAISRQIVKMHGGHLSVVSTPGRGSTFHIDIPVRFKPDTQGVS